MPAHGKLWAGRGPAVAAAIGLDSDENPFEGRSAMPRKASASPRIGAISSLPG